MKEERAWRWMGMIALIINWLNCFGLAVRLVEGPFNFGLPRPIFLLLGLTPAILLTVARKWSLNDPWLMTRVVLGTGLAVPVGSAMLRVMHGTMYFSLFEPKLWPWTVPPLIYLGITIAVLMTTRAGLKNEPYEPTPNDGRRFTRRLKYLIWLNFSLLAVTTTSWVFVGVVVLGLATLAAWRRSAVRPILALGLTAVQAAALAAWLHGPEKFDTETLPVFQIAASAVGLLVVVSAEATVRLFKRRSASAEPGFLSRPVWWALSTVAGIIICLSGIYFIQQYFLPHQLPTITYTGPMETIQMGRIELQVPPGGSGPWITARATWTEGEVSINDYIFKDSRPASDQFSDHVDRALDTRSREKIQAMIAETTKEFASRLGLDELESPPTPTSARTAKTVDEHFQSSARLVSGGAVSEIELFVERPEGYLVFEYDPRKASKSDNRPERSESDNEAWLIERARELLGIYTWTGRQANGSDGFRMSYGVLRPPDRADFSLKLTGWIIDKDQGFNLDLRSVGLYKYLYSPSPEDQKQRLFGYALKEIFEGQLNRNFFRSQSLAGVPGLVHVRLRRNWRGPDVKNNMIATWVNNSELPLGLAEMEMSCNKLADEADVAAKLGLWRAIIESVRYLDAPPEPKTTSEAVTD